MALPLDQRRRGLAARAREPRGLVAQAKEGCSLATCARESRCLAAWVLGLATQLLRQLFVALP